MRHTFFKNENFHLEYEEVEFEPSIIGIHCSVTNWKLSSLKEVIKIFAKMQNHFSEKGVIQFITLSLNPKFCLVLGGKRIGTVETNGTTYEVFTWALK